MLRGRGAPEDARVLGRKGVELMTMNHLPGDLADMGQRSIASTLSRLSPLWLGMLTVGLMYSHGRTAPGAAKTRGRGASSMGA